MEIQNTAQGSNNPEITIIEITQCMDPTLPDPIILPRTQQQIKIFGGIPINSLLYFFIPLINFACLYCYYQAVSKNEEPSFPHVSITKTAYHYPQNIIFRYFVLPGGAFVSLIFFVAFRWLSKLKKQTNYPGTILSRLFYLAEASILGFYGAIATIDEKELPMMHWISADIFFICLLIFSALISKVLRDLHKWDASCVCKRSVFIKSIMSLYLFGVGVYFLIGLFSDTTNENQIGEDAYWVTAEWNLVIGSLTWLLTFVLDWRGIQISFKGNLEDSVKKINQ